MNLLFVFRQVHNSIKIFGIYMDYFPHLILRFQVGDRSIGIRKTIHDVCTVVQDMLKEVEAQVIF